MSVIGLYLDIDPNDSKPKYKADLAVREIKMNASGVVISLAVPSTVELKVGTRIVLLYAMFGNQCGYVLRCRLDEIRPEYLKCSFE